MNELQKQRLRATVAHAKASGWISMKPPEPRKYYRPMSKLSTEQKRLNNIKSTKAWRLRKRAEKQTN